MADRRANIEENHRAIALRWSVTVETRERFACPRPPRGAAATSRSPSAPYWISQVCRHLNDFVGRAFAKSAGKFTVGDSIRRFAM